MTHINGYPKSIIEISDRLEEVDIFGAYNQLIRGFTTEEVTNHLESDGLEPGAAKQLEAKLRALRIEHINAYLASHPLPALNLIFHDLRAAGVDARENFSCCGSCGHYELNSQPRESAPAPGYVFFNEQTTENLVDRGSVWFGYGSLDPSIDDDAFIDSVVDPIFVKHGYPLSWTTKGNQKILDGIDVILWFADIRPPGLETAGD